MKTRMSLVAALAVMAGPAFAQEPPAAPSTQEKAPSMQSDQMAPSTAPAPEAPAAAQPAPAPTPAAVPDKQAAAPSGPSEIVVGELRATEDDNKMVSPLNATVNKTEEMDVYDANGKKIAEVDSVLEDKNGEIKGLAIEYGGFLGFGEKEAIVTFDQVKLKDGKLVTEVTEDQLPTLPVWNK
jgi:sporulation protein YlmC with PRC-barrel domain